MDIFKIFKDIKKRKEQKRFEEIHRQEVKKEASRIWPILTDEDKWAIKEDIIPFSLSKIFPEKNDVWNKLRKWVNNY